MLHRSEAWKKRELETILSNCRSTLASLDEFLGKYHSLGSNQPRALDRLRFGKHDLTRIRGQLVLHTSTIGLFLLGLDTESLGRIEQRLDEMVVEMRKGKREPTTIIILGEKNGTRDVDWRGLGAELQRAGMKSEDIVAHQHGIRAYVQEQVEKYQLPNCDTSRSDRVLEQEQRGDHMPSAITEDPRGAKNRGTSQLIRPPSLNPYPPPNRPLPQIPESNPSTNHNSSDTTATVINIPPHPTPSTEVWHQRPDNGNCRTETDVQEYDERGQLRKRTITRQSSSSSLRSSLPSAHTSPAFEPAVIQALADLKSEQELINFSLDETKRRLSGTTQGGVSSRASAASLSSKSIMTDADAELEGWKRRAKLYRDLWAKQKKQTQAAKAQEANIRQTVQQVTREREYYKRQLEALEAARLSRPQSTDGSRGPPFAAAQATEYTTRLGDVDRESYPAEQSPVFIAETVGWHSSLHSGSQKKGHDPLPVEARVWEWFDMSPEKWNHLL